MSEDDPPRGGYLYWFPLTCDEFLKGFWPNFASTLGGVGVGVPVALWINRIAERRFARRQRAETHERVGRALDAVKEALSKNLPGIREVSTLVESGGYVTGLPLNTAVWGATHGELVPHLDPLLSAGLAHHFQEVDLLMAHAERHSRYFIGMESALGGGDRVRGKLGVDLKPFADRLATRCDHLLRDVQAAQAGFGGSNATPPTPAPPKPELV
jgi:hypothetical protein